MHRDKDMSLFATEMQAEGEDIDIVEAEDVDDIEFVDEIEDLDEE